MSARREARRRRLLKRRDAAKSPAPKCAAPGQETPKEDAPPANRVDRDTSADAEADVESRAERLKVPEAALDALEFQARRFYRRWRLAQAEAVSRRILHFDSRRPRAWQVLGDIAMRRADWEQAFESFEAALCDAPDDPVLWCRGAEALFQLREYERAERWFAEVLRLDSSGEWGAARRARGFLAYHAKTFERAVRFSDQPDRSAELVDDATRVLDKSRIGLSAAGENKTQALSEKELQAALAERSQATHRRKARPAGSPGAKPSPRKP